MTLLTILPILLASVPWQEITVLAEEVVTGKATRNQLVATIPHILDDCIDFDTILPGMVGVFLEAEDGVIEAKIVEWIADRAISKASRKVPATAVEAHPPGRRFFRRLQGHRSV